MTAAEVHYDLFISYADADRAWVEGYLLDALQQAGIHCHSAATFHLGAPLLEEFERAVQQSQRVLLVLTPAYLTQNLDRFVSLLAQHYGLESGAWPVIPLLLEEVKLPPRLAVLVPLDARNPDDWETVVARLCQAAKTASPSPAAPPPCPYPGMVAFREQDSPAFYGREPEIEEMVQRLRHHRFLTVIGPSGSGKSSLVFAGLLPALRRSTLFGSNAWLVKALRPDVQPLVTLANVLGGTGVEPVDLSTLLTEATHLLLVVDQFEELFTLGSASADAFLQRLQKLLSDERCYLVLTVRADFYADLMTCALWPEISQHRLEVTPLNGAGLRRAIVQPAENVGVFIESALVERLVSNNAGQPGVLPFVQEVLVLLWSKLQRRFLPMRAYETLILANKTYTGDERSGIQVAMARVADGVVAGLAGPQKQLARRVLLRLIQFGEGRADTRRQQTVDQLRSGAEDARLLEQTLRYLAKFRLVVLSGDEAGGQKVDLAHEAMISGWPLLGEWIKAQRLAEQTRRRLEEKAVEWVRFGRSDGGLLDEIELAEAQYWQQSPAGAELGASQDLLALLDKSRAAIVERKQAAEAAQQRELLLEKRARRRLQGLVALLSLIVLVGAGWFARLEYWRQTARRLGEAQSIVGLNLSYERFEVTNQRYRLCVQAGRCVEPPSLISTYFQENTDDFPITGIHALQAAAFCDWIGRRLPTVNEWHVVATQAGKTQWPWGDIAPSPNEANLWHDVSQLPKEQPQPIQTHANGASPDGIEDLVGNVAEWTQTAWDSQTGEFLENSVWNYTLEKAPPDYLATVGGSFKSTADPPVPTGTENSLIVSYIGFRCVE